MPLVSYGFWEVAVPAFSILTSCKWQQCEEELCPPPSSTCLKHNPEGMCFRCRMLGRAQALQQNDSIWCTLHFFPMSDKQLLRLQKVKIKQRGCPRQPLSDPLWFTMSKWHKHMASSKKKRGREKEGVESEKGMGKKCGPFGLLSIALAYYVNICCKIPVLKTEKCIECILTSLVHHGICSSLKATILFILFIVTI